MPIHYGAPLRRIPRCLSVRTMRRGASAELLLIVVLRRESPPRRLVAYIIARNDPLFVAYDGNDPRTGKERRSWHPAGRSRADAEAIAVRLSAERRGTRERPTSALTVEQFLLEVWLPRRQRELRPSTARRYQWYVDNYITPAIGAHRLAGLRAEHLDRMYNDLLGHGGRDGGALSAKTVYDVHVVMRSSLRFAVDRHLVDHNVAADARPPRISTRSRRSIPRAPGPSTGYGSGCATTAGPGRSRAARTPTGP